MGALRRRYFTPQIQRLRETHTVCSEKLRKREKTESERGRKRK